MVHSRFRSLRQAALALCCASALGAAAQTPVAAPTARMADKANPLDALAPVPALRYQPAFAGYKGVLDQPVGNWIAANDRTAQIGGWRAYAKQASEPEAALPGTADSKPGMPARAAPAASMPAGHGQHKSP